MIPKSLGDAVEGKKLVAVGRKISKPIIIPATAQHSGQQVYIHGNPARCYVDRPTKILRK